MPVRRTLHLPLRVAALVGLLVQAAMGPIAPGVALCLSFHACADGSPDRAVERAIERTDDRDGCCGGACPRDRVETTSASAGGFIPSVGLRLPCGDGCGDCVDLEPSDDAFAIGARAVGPQVLVRALDAPTSDGPLGFGTIGHDATFGLPTARPPNRCVGDPRAHAAWSAARVEIVRSVRLQR